MSRKPANKPPFNKARLVTYGLCLIGFMALTALAMGLLIDDIASFGFGGN